ncbi:nicotinamide riboside transporter PnuC [Polluticaenibacter yanchengensis]|uniref:Nicotinamide riboside transporter PnuC n=1 Tax=Polluticaenibacter yanchengensis TaxID=3014562 RepID=A0ABT4UPJ5_9BACT|nr:nicotinamide riboside transporter PnuC [Chitinophagaceae bacterium LY-5]
MQEFLTALSEAIKSTTLLEYFAVLMGILSVYYSRKENILVFPTGLINTAIYIYLSYRNHLVGETSVNFYYTIMNIWGWIAWSRMNNEGEGLKISVSTNREIIYQLGFFAFIGTTYYIAITQLKAHFYPGALPLPDAIASAAAFTAMWLMTKKKIENWYWWLLTNIICMPIYFSKGLMLTSVQYLVFFIFAVLGLKEWRIKLKNNI